MKDELDTSSEYKEKLEEFEMTRKYLTEVFGLNQTLKMHVIKEHFKTYFKMTGKTLKKASTEYHEAVHHSHKSHEKKRGFYQKKGLGSATHQKRSQSGIVQFNVLHAGFAKKSDLQLRKPKKKPSSFVDICEI